MSKQTISDADKNVSVETTPDGVKFSIDINLPEPSSSETAAGKKSNPATPYNAVDQTMMEEIHDFGGCRVKEAIKEQVLETAQVQRKLGILHARITNIDPHITSIHEKLQDKDKDTKLFRTQLDQVEAHIRALERVVGDDTNQTSHLKASVSDWVDKKDKELEKFKETITEVDDKRSVSEMLQTSAHHQLKADIANLQLSILKIQHVVETLAFQAVVQWTHTRQDVTSMPMRHKLSIPKKDDPVFKMEKRNSIIPWDSDTDVSPTTQVSNTANKDKKAERESIDSSEDDAKLDRGKTSPKGKDPLKIKSQHLAEEAGSSVPTVCSPGGIPYASREELIYSFAMMLFSATTDAEIAQLKGLLLLLGASPSAPIVIPFKWQTPEYRHCLTQVLSVVEREHNPHSLPQKLSQKPGYDWIITPSTVTERVCIDATQESVDTPKSTASKTSKSSSAHATKSSSRHASKSSSGSTSK